MQALFLLFEDRVSFPVGFLSVPQGEDKVTWGVRSWLSPLGSEPEALSSPLRSGDLLARYIHLQLPGLESGEETSVLSHVLRILQNTYPRMKGGSSGSRCSKQ